MSMESGKERDDRERRNNTITWVVGFIIALILGGILSC